MTQSAFSSDPSREGTTAAPGQEAEVFKLAGSTTAPWRPFCLNCTTQLIGKFCHNCGQQPVNDCLSVRSVLLETVRQISKWDSALMRTVTTLFRYPAEVTIAYLVGQRQLFVAPTRYIMFALALEFTTSAGLKWIASEIGHQAALNWLEYSGRAYLIRFLQVIMLASSWRLLFKRGHYNLAETYLFGLYVYAQMTLINVALNVLAVLVPMHPMLQSHQAFLIQSSVDFVYLTFAARNFFTESWFATISKLLLSFLLPLALFWAWLRFAQ